MSDFLDDRPVYRDDVLPSTYQQCFGCGDANSSGVGLSDIRRDGEVVHASFTPRPDHQGFPGILHGGIAMAALDETMSYACTLVAGTWAATAKMELRFRRPVPLGVVLTLTAGLDEHSSKRFRTWGRLSLPDGTVAVEAEALFMAAPDELVAGLTSA